MATALIVYGSTTGNTAYVAETVGRNLTEAGITVTVKEAPEIVKHDGFAAGYDAVLLGCSTWGDSDIEMQDDFFPLFGHLNKGHFAGKKVAAFGCGDSSYTHFCGAVDEIERALDSLGAKFIAGGLRIDGDPRSEKKEIDAWSKEVTEAITGSAPVEGAR